MGTLVNKILEDLGKTKKSNEVTELSVVDVNLSITETMRKKRDEVLKLKVNAVKEADKLEKSFLQVREANDRRKQEASNLNREIMKQFLDAKNMAQQLGIDVPQEVKKIADEASELAGKIPTSNRESIFTLN